MGPFWKPRSIIKASSIAFDVVYTQSRILNDVISVLNGFCFRGGFEIEQNFIENLFSNVNGIKTACGSLTGTIFQPSGFDFRAILASKMAPLREGNRPRKRYRIKLWIRWPSGPHPDRFWNDFGSLLGPFSEDFGACTHIQMDIHSHTSSSWKTRPTSHGIVRRRSNKSIDRSRGR